MLKWFSNEEGSAGQGAPGSPQGGVGAVAAGGGGQAAVAELLERLAQTEQLVTQLKELIREKDGVLCTKDEQLKAEKDACEAKLSKLRLQNKAKVTSLTAQLEELKKGGASGAALGDHGTPTHSKKGGADGSEQASRGKILLLRKKVEELEHQLSQRTEELEVKSHELEAQRKRGADMDVMLAERDRKLSEKEAYIVHLQMGLASGDHTAVPPATPDTEQRASPEESGAGALSELQLLVQSLTRKVGESEERYSLLQEQTESLKELLVTEKATYQDKENMYKQNIQTFKDIILQKDNQLMEVSKMHEQELFKLAAKSDASADLEQLLKALKQKLHEKEEVLQGKNQVIDVLQGEVDGRDLQIKELMERAQRLQVERESLGSKMEAEKHVMRAQLRDLLEKHQGELRSAAESHEARLAEHEQALRGQLEQELGRSLAPQTQMQTGTSDPAAPDSQATTQRMTHLEAQAKLKSEEASKSEAKFLKIKAWSKSRIRQLEDELRKSQSGHAGPDVTSLRSRITDLEEEREEVLWKLEQYEELKAKNDVLEAKLVVYEEQQRKMAADLEQVTKRAASQASESGSADDTQSQVLEWQEMVSEAVTARDRAREEKATMALRMSHMEEEREALASRQQELEEELSQARGHTGPHRGSKKLEGAARQHSLQEDFEFDGKQAFHQDRRDGSSESTTPMEEEGENMGGWWPEYTSPDTGGLRSVVEELELERNQLQEQILGLEERCQDLEDRLQLQARIESLQSESERLQGQLSSLRNQQSRDAEKHQLLVTSLNEQLKGLSDTQECLETSLIEKENTLVKTSEKLELIDSLRDSLQEREAQQKEVSDKLLQSEHNLAEVSAKCKIFEKQCSELKTVVADLTQKQSVLKEKTQKQEAMIETLQTDLDQTNDELDKLNTTHLEERAQLIHDLQSCEREIDNLRDTVLDKDKEILALSGNMAEYAEQIMALKQEIKHKEEELVRLETSLTKSEREAQIIRDSQSSDQQALNIKTAELMEQLKYAQTELCMAKEEKEAKMVEVEDLSKQVDADKRTILELRGEIQKQNIDYGNHLKECETQISSLKEQVTVGYQKLHVSEGLASAYSVKLNQFQDKEQACETELKSVKEERNKLLEEVDRHNSELKTLSTRLENQVECQEKLKQEVHEKQKKIYFLEEQLRTTQEEAEAEQRKFYMDLQARDSEKKILAKDLQGESENITKMQNLLKNMNIEKQQLQDDIEKKAEELKSQKQLVEELNEKCTAALELNSSLSSQANSFTEENQRMQQDVAVKDKLLLEMTNDRDSLMNKISFFETQHSDNSKVIEGLLKDKEELTVRVNELNNSLEKNKLSISESLFEKTNECNLLTKTLREKEVAVAHLQDQVDSLNSQLEEVNHNMAEKEKMITDQHSQIEMHRSQLSQLQVTMSLLQEQDSALRAGLTEKDIIFQQKTEECSSLQNKLGQQKKLLSKLQGETKSLKGQCSQLTQNLKEKEENLRQMTQDCEDQKDELNKKNESLKSLSSQLGVINETSAKLESENTELKVSLENHETENNKLRQEMDQRQAEMVVLHNHIQALNEQNQQLRAAYEIREKELAQQIQVASDLDRRVNVTLEENTNLSSLLNSLTEEKNKLQQELNVQSESVSELTKEKNSLQDKLSNFEMKHSESCKMIDGLLKDKKELSVTVDELKTVLVQNTQSISESVLQKTNECSDLTKLLRGSEEALTCSQQQVDSLNIQLNQLNGNMTEKENTIKIQYSQIEAQQSELSNLQETLALLQEQVTTLKSGLTEKDIMVQQKTEECSSLQNKLGQQKKLLSKLQGETKSLKGQCSQLTQRLEEKEENLRQMAQDCENQKDELNKKNESLKSLSSQLGVMNETSAKLESEITELKASHENHETKNIKLRQEMDQRQAEMVVLHNHIQALNEQNQQLRAAYEIREKELAQQIQVASDLDRRVNVTLEENTNLSSLLNSLTEEKNKLQQELNIQSESVSELTKEKNSLQDKLSNFEMKHSENCKMIDGLLKDKKELSVTVDELKTVLVQNTQSISESVLQKTNECSDLTKLLRGSEEALTCSQQQVESLNIQLNQLNGNMTEKENTIKIQNSQIEAQQSELLNLQETLALLQEQVTTLKSGLTEKDMILQQKVEECSSLQIELRQQKTLLSKLRDENESLLGQCSQLTQRLGEKEENLTKMAQELENHKDELDKKNESLKSLGSQLDVVNETHAMLESENTELKTSLETLAADNNKLRQEMDQRHSEVRDLKDNIQALNEQNVRLKSEFRNSVTEASKQLEEISTLKAGILNRDSDVSDLKEQLSTACSEKESLVLSLQQRDKSLKQQEEFIKQLEAQSVEGKGQMSHAITELQTHVQSLQQSLQDKDVSLHESAKQLNLLRDKLTLESEGFKTQLSSNAEAMAELQRDLYNSVEKRNQLNVRMEEQEAVLKQKVDDYVSLRKYVSEMEDSLMQLRSQVSSLTSESSLLKETLKEKDSVFMEAQRSSSAISENLHFQLQAKDTECESLKEQVSHLKESVSKLSGSLIAQSSEMSRLQEAFEEKGTAVMDQSKALQEMERRADEAALFKTQFMESTELVSQLQGQIQELSVKYSSLNQSAEENQSAFVNLQEKYAAHLEELKEAQTLLSQRTEEMLSLNNALGDSKSAVQAAESTILELRNECSSLHQELQQIQALNVDLSKEKEEALATHQRSTSLFTVEIERLKSQYIHVAAQVNALTENLEQREMALHAINSQYTAQVKQTEHLLSEMQKLEDQNKKLRLEITLSNEESQQKLDAAISENQHLQQEVQKLIIERDECVRSYSSQIQTMQVQLQLQRQQQSSNTNEAIEKMVSEKERLQLEVSVKGEEITGLKSDIEKIGQTLQDSEKEWLLVLDRETHDKNLIAEQLRSVQKEMKTKDCKVQALKQDLDSLHEKLAEAATAIRQGSDLLKAKEVEASTSRVQLENILTSVQEKDKHNFDLRQALKDMESELRQLEVSKETSDKDLSVLSLTMSDRLVALEEENASLQSTIKDLSEKHQSEVDCLRGELNQVSESLKRTECALNDKEIGYRGENPQNVLLQEKIQHLNAQLQTDNKNLREEGIKNTTLLSEIQIKDEQVSCMTIQISEQKELLAGLAQQLREKDDSVAQIIESASNERMKYTEEKSFFLSQLESLENAHSSTQKHLENMSLQLKQSQDSLSHTLCEIKTKDSENMDLVKEKDNLKAQLAKLTKEKELMKKKLQAALVVRKDLLKKIEEYENQKEQNKNNGSEISSLQVRVQELTSQAEATIKVHEAVVADLQQQMVLKDGEFLKLAQDLSLRDSLVEQLEEKNRTLQAKLDEQEASLITALHDLNDKSLIIDQLHSNISEQEVAFEQERSVMKQELENLQEDKKKSKEGLKEEMPSFSTTADDIIKELEKVKQEKAMMQKKAQAALLARKETIRTCQESEKKYIQELTEIKDDYTALMERHSQQTNRLNAVQLSYDQKVKEFEDISQASVAQICELKTLKLNVQERDKTLQDLKILLSERENKTHANSTHQAELEALHLKLESMSIELANKENSVKALEQNNKVMSERLSCTENQLEKAETVIKEKMEEFARQQHALETVQQQHQQEKQSMLHDHMVLESQLRTLQATIVELKHTLEAQVIERESQSQTFISENRVLKDDRDRTIGELAQAFATIAQESSKIEVLQNAWSKTEQQLNEEKKTLKVELEKALSDCAEIQAEMQSKKLHMESLQRDKESVYMVMEQLKSKIAMQDAQLMETGKVNEELTQKISGLQDKYSEQVEAIKKKEFEFLKVFPEEHEVILKERNEALLISQALVTEKEELISVLEQQLQRQIHLHEVAMEKMKTEVDELQQKSQEDSSKTNDMDNQSKTALLTRKLHAALVSRKEILKENSSLKEHVQTLLAKIEHAVTSSTELEMSVAELKQKNEILETSVSSLSKEKEKLLADVDRILNDNHNLSAACESLKLTIESITHQKQAFSCQLESLKDLQTDELSEWKSKHTELKQEYESLLQAYENVSSEMDKMRQLLEVARKERQEALFKAHKSESERENLEQQLSEMEEENEKIKEKMREFTKAKQQKVEELEKENKKIKRDLLEFDKKATVEELTIKNNLLNAEIHSLVMSSEELRGKLTEMQLDNVRLAEELKEANCSLENWHIKSKACEQNLQQKLDDALNLNNSWTTQIESLKKEIAAHLEINESMQKEKETISEIIKQMENEHKEELGEKDHIISEFQEIINRNRQETIQLNEKVRILEDDKSLLQEELENVQEISDKVKNENEYLETVIIKNSERIDELTEAVNVLQAQNTQLSSQLTESKEQATQVCREKEQQQLKLVKEFEERLKHFQRGSEGSKNVKKELQELLKEKHHEINQLQLDSIKYQELILDLERSLKVSESAREQVEKEFKEMSDKIYSVEDGRQHLESELTTHKNLLNEAKKDLANIISEKDRLVAVVSEKKKQTECQALERTKALQNVAEQQKSIFMEREVILQHHIEELLGSKEKENQVVLELKKQIDSQDLQISTLKREADTNLAKLAALSSSPQGADALQQWNDMFLNTLHEKDSQLLEQGFVITKFLEDIRVKEKEVNELQVTKSRLERALADYTVAATAHQRQLFIMGASNRELNETVELLNQQLQESSEQVERLEQDKSTLNRLLSGSVDSTSKMQFDCQHLEKTLADTESQLLFSQSLSDKLQVDLEKQEAISNHLKSILQNKEAEISSLLSSRDGQMSGYLEQLQANHHAQVAGFEDRITALYYEREKGDKEFRRLEHKVKSLQVKVDKSIQEKEQMAAQMETFRNSMMSLQTERERLVSEYRMSEARNQTGLQAKEGSVEGDHSATKGLKHEIRTLLHQMDDLNSENAMLRAQLIRYREDLNQVLSLKDSQLKELLKKQQETIKNLENQKTTAEKQNRRTLLELEKDREASSALKAENSKLHSHITDLEAKILALNMERAETNKGKVIADLQQAVAAKSVECNDLQQKLFAQKVAVDDLKGSMQLLQSETENKLGEAEEKYNSELEALEQEVELLRNEKENTNQRVSNLTRELMQTEQLLSEARGQSQELKSQNESLGKAMAALQNNRDQLIEDFKILRNRYDEELRETQGAMAKLERRLGDSSSEKAALTTERDILVQKITALESKDAFSQLTTLVDKLSVTLSETERQLKRVSLENDTYSRQVSAFSRSMASLQDDRDRLMEELVGANWTSESRQRSGPEAVDKGDPCSHRSSSIEALQTERGGLEKRQRVAEVQNALQQAEAIKLQTEREACGYQAELAELRSERSRLQSECQRLAGERKETVALTGKSSEGPSVAQLQAERTQLQGHLQRCLYEIQQRDLHCQQLDAKLQQVVEEKVGVSTQLRAVSQTLRDTQNRCYWLENQASPHQHNQGLGQQGAGSVEVAPGAPQEKCSAVVDMDALEAGGLRTRLAGVEQNVVQLMESLAEERARREAAEEALGLAEERANSVGSSPSKSTQRDFSIQLEAEDEWEALILNPNEPLVTRKVKGGVLACRRWLRGRSLYCSKLLTSRTRSRYLFLGYLLLLHVAVLMCLTGAL